MKKKDFIKLREDISFLISRTLDETLRNTDDVIKDCYKKLIESFDVTISFNWDILYEYTYTSLKEKSISNYPKQMGFSKIELCKPALLKLHGSLSWGKCEKCGLYISDTKIQHIIHNKGMQCPNCHENKLTSTSILPALTKFETVAETDYPPFRNIWYCAMHAITEAEEIHFIGYSLSDNDLHTKIFFKNGILNNINPNLKIYVINKKCSEDLKERYNKTFGGKVQPIFKEESFKDHFTNS